MGKTYIVFNGKNKFKFKSSMNLEYTNFDIPAKPLHKNRGRIPAAVE